MNNGDKFDRLMENRYFDRLEADEAFWQWKEDNMPLASNQEAERAYLDYLTAQKNSVY